MSDFIHAEEKVYAVEFMQYTNCMHDCVDDEKTSDMLSLPSHSTFLVRESELDKYRRFGGGYKSTNYVGVMVFNDKNDA